MLCRPLADVIATGEYAQCHRQKCTNRWGSCTKDRRILIQSDFHAHPFECMRRITVYVISCLI